jgi:hypothetical protein
MGGVPQENEQALRARARQRIGQGLLPREKPTRMWGGRGTGAVCNLCDRPIDNSEPEMELEYEPSAGVSSVRLHLRCQSIWDAAREASLTSQWIPLKEQLPPLRTIVEARISFGNSRSVILSVMRVCDGETGPVVWLNATTNSQLPELWHPVEWRALPESAPLPVTTVPPVMTRRA